MRNIQVKMISTFVKIKSPSMNKVFSIGAAFNT